MNCPTCGSKMVEMFFSSFCPNNCDKQIKEEEKAEDYVACTRFQKLSDSFIDKHWNDAVNTTKKEEVKTENTECQEDSTDEELVIQELEDQYGEDLIAEFRTGCYCDKDAQSIKEYFADHYEGGYPTMGDWAHEWLENTGQLDKISEYIGNYINFDAYGIDAIYGGEFFRIEVNGTLHVFRNA